MHHSEIIASQLRSRALQLDNMALSILQDVNRDVRYEAFGSVTVHSRAKMVACVEVLRSSANDLRSIAEKVAPDTFGSLPKLHHSGAMVDALLGIESFRPKDRS